MLRGAVQKRRAENTAIGPNFYKTKIVIKIQDTFNKIQVSINV